MRELAGRVAVVTGAASGIGFGLAERFGREGMKVAMADIEGPALSEAADLLAGRGLEVLPVLTDVSDPAAVYHLRDEVVRVFGVAHVLCNNAGVVAGGTLWELTPEGWDWVLGVNLKGVVNGIRAFVPLLGEQPEAHIVNTASMAGLATAALGSYSVTKHAVVALSEALYHQLQLRGLSQVGVSVLCPGWVKTRISEAERNLPPGVEPAPRRPEEEALRAMFDELIRSGMEPAQVAEQVLDAIRSGRFYVVTHPEMMEAAERRWQDIRSGGPPTLALF